MKTPAPFLILILILIMMMSPGAMAAGSGDDVTELEEIVVVATRAPRPLLDVAGTVSVIDAGQISDRLGLAAPDLIAEDPGISLPRAGTRFGWGSYSIRGVGGNRVAIELDGVPVADQFQIGSFSNAGRDLVDVSILKRVEFLRGPASTLYGSDAIGGVVAYRTFEPADLAGPNDAWFSLRGGYRDDLASVDANLASAFSGERFGGLVSLTQRDGEQRDTAALGSAAEDTQDWDSRSVFGKFTLAAAGDARLTGIVDRFERDSATDIRSVLGSGRFSSTTLLTGDDNEQRDRLSLALDFSADKPWITTGRLIAYAQRSETTQDSIEERAASDIRRARKFEYEQETSGLRIDASTDLAGSVFQHRVGYGLSWADTQTTEQRDALQTTLAGTDPTPIILGETFPVRDFPVSDTQELGLYLHDEITRDGSRWTFIPAVRFDSYELDPRPDALYLEDNPQADIARIDENNVSPKLGFVYALADRWRIFGQYARGFRAPPFEDANIGLDIPLFNIRALPNPDLKSETSDGLELGLRHSARDASFGMALHYTRYDDFIESRARLGPDETGTLLFQSRNIASARIYGAELSGRRVLSAIPARIGRIEASAAVAWTRGENDVSDRPLNAIDPAEAVLTLAWDAPQRPVTARLVWTLVDAKGAIDDPDGELFRPSGFGVVDAMARYRISKNAVLRAGVFNLTDKTYWRWASVKELDLDDPTLPYLSEPGRYAGASVEISW